LIFALDILNVRHISTPGLADLLTRVTIFARSTRSHELPLSAEHHIPKSEDL